MIKGCQRRIIMVKDTGSRYFEGAYFVLRSELSGTVKESEMICEAEQIIGSCTDISTAASFKSASSTRPYKIAIAVLASALFASLAALFFF